MPEPTPAIIAPPVLVEAPIPEIKRLLIGPPRYYPAICSPGASMSDWRFFVSGSSPKNPITTMDAPFARSCGSIAEATLCFSNALDYLATDWRDATMVVLLKPHDGPFVAVAAYRIADGQMAEKEVAVG